VKLRVKGNSIRLRVTRSELARLQSGQSIQETVHFSSDPSARLGYTLEIGSHSEPVTVVFVGQQIVVSISRDQLTGWSGEHQVGIYASLPIDETTTLEVALEKDFACLDLSDEDNADTFTNPLAGKAC
jgi:hypothetical protein